MYKIYSYFAHSLEEAYSKLTKEVGGDVGSVGKGFIVSVTYNPSISKYEFLTLQGGSRRSTSQGPRNEFAKNEYSAFDSLDKRGKVTYYAELVYKVILAGACDKWGIKYNHDKGLFAVPADLKSINANLHSLLSYINKNINFSVTIAELNEVFHKKGYPFTLSIDTEATANLKSNHTFYLLKKDYRG